MGREKSEHLVLLIIQVQVAQLLLMIQTENAFSEKSLVESNKRTLLGGKSPENQAQQVSMTAIMRSPVLESLSS